MSSGTRKIPATAIGSHSSHLFGGLVATWSVVDSDGLGMAGGVPCGDAPTDFEVPADGSIEDTIAWGALPIGEWTGEAGFETPVPPNPTVVFVVQ